MVLCLSVTRGHDSSATQATLSNSNGWSLKIYKKVCKFVCSIFALFCLFVWVEALHPSQQFFSHVGTEPPLPGYYQYFLGGKCILLKDTTRRPE